MKRVITCTAGHVDHGKTTLVRALTGIDCDTHPEEKARGININPGFAHLELRREGDEAEVVRIGIVDVPGHHRFIRNMLAGASAVDMALLTVAVDDGVMPQTREHLALLQLLGTRQGVVALTKADVADADLIEMAEAELRDSHSESFLANAEIVPVSAARGTGLDELLAAILGSVERVVERPVSAGFRMYIDRIFSVAGFGTIVTGSVIGGTVRVDDSLRVLPGDTEVRVRRMHHRRRTERGVQQVRRRASSSLAERFLSEVDKHITFVGVRELGSVLGADPEAVKAAVVRFDGATGVRVVATEDDVYLLAERAGRGAAALAGATASIRERFRGAGLHVVSLSELEAAAAEFKLALKDTKAIVRHLVEEGELVSAERSYLSGDVVTRCRLMLLERLSGAAGKGRAAFASGLRFSNRGRGLSPAAPWKIRGVR